MSLQGGLGIERMCLLAGISRAGFYRHLRAQDPWEEEMAYDLRCRELRSNIRGVTAIGG